MSAKIPFLRMHCENMAQNRPNCCQLTEIFVAITCGKLIMAVEN